MAANRSFIVNGVVGIIVISCATVLTFRLILKSCKDKDFWGHSRLLFIMVNMALVWSFQIALFVFQKRAYFFLCFAPLLYLLSTFCFSHWYFDSVRKTVSLEMGKCALFTF